MEHIPNTQHKEGKSRYDKAKIKLEWFLRVGGFVMLFANLWLTQHFVTVEKYETDRKEQQRETEIFRHDATSNLTKLSLILETMAERNKVNDRQDEAIKDHESRLRHLESGKSKK